MTKERDQCVALSLLLINFGTECLDVSLLWLCCLLTLHQVTEEQDLLLLVKIAKFTYSGNCIIGHMCDVDILGNLTAYTLFSCNRQLTGTDEPKNCQCSSVAPAPHYVSEQV